MFFRNAAAKQRGILVFDVNETLLDVKALRPHFERLFSNPEVLKEWFAQMLLYSQTVTQTGQYVDFGELARAALKMVGEIHGIQVAERDIGGVVKSMRALPAYPEVAGALDRLREAGFRTVALTNSGEAAAKEQLKNAGLDSRFERVFTVDAVKAYKPAPAAYRHVAGELGVQTAELTMIAAHPWDLLGAESAGCKIAFLQREGTAWFPLRQAPSVMAENLSDLAERLIEVE